MATLGMDHGIFHSYHEVNHEVTIVTVDFDVTLFPLQVQADGVGLLRGLLRTRIQYIMEHFCFSLAKACFFWQVAGQSESAENRGPDRLIKF